MNSRLLINFWETEALRAVTFSCTAALSVTGGSRAWASAAAPAQRRGRHLKRRFADRTPDPPSRWLWAGPGARILTSRAGGLSLFPPRGVRFGGSAWGPERASCQGTVTAPATQARGSAAEAGEQAWGRPADSGQGQPGPSADGPEGRRSPGWSPITHGRGSSWGRRVWAAPRRQN